MFWFYSVKRVARLEIENEMLRAENLKLSARLANSGDLVDLFTDTVDPEGDREFEKSKKAIKDNREQFDDFAGGATSVSN